MFQHKLTIYRLHYKNAYSDEKEPKRREREWERNEEIQKGKSKEVKNLPKKQKEKKKLKNK